MIYLRIILIFCIFGFGMLTVHAGEKLPLATGEWPPYTSERMTGGGLFTEIVSAIVHEMGMQPEFKFYPWKRAESVVRKGKVFAAFPYAITEKRLINFDFSDVVIQNNAVLFFNKKHIKHPLSLRI